MPFKGSVEVRRRGLAIAVDLSSEDYATNVQSKCRRAGLLITTEGETLLLLPALTIDLAVAREGLDILEECV